MNFCLLFFFPLVYSGCVNPTGLGTEIGEIDFNSVLISSTTGLLFDVNDEFINNTEPIITFREFAYANIAFYNVRIAYNPISNDFFSRKNARKIRNYCNINSTYLTQHEIISHLYTIYFVFRLNYPSKTSELDNIMKSGNLIDNICDNEDYNCYDITTPWGLAYITVSELWEFSYFDGYNFDGSYNREFNKIPYSDYRDKPYIPKNNPWVLKKEDKWQPLLESDHLGFLFNQEHVVPHIGFTGVLFFTPDDYFCSLSSPDPEYNYDYEMKLAIDRLANLTDKKKAEIELFDNKDLSLLPLFMQWLAKSGTDLLPISNMVNAMFFITLHESSIVVWRHKILHDLIRPPSIIHYKLAGKTITSYAGTDVFGNSLGTQTFLADDWEPYIRTMPHSEYPSASACVCKAFAQAMIRFTGYDSFEGHFDGQLTLEFPAFSSAVEPGTTAKEDLTLVFKSWSEISQRCSESRLNGGMHFTASIKAGEDLCSNIGNIVFEAMNSTYYGQKPEFVVDFYDRKIRQDRCDEYRNNRGGKGKHGSNRP